MHICTMQMQFILQNPYQIKLQRNPCKNRARKFRIKTTTPLPQLAFFLDDVLQSRQHLVFRERSESESGASRLQSRNDLGEIVANEAESRVLRVLLDDSTQSVLSVVRHRISFVQYH